MLFVEVKLNILVCNLGLSLCLLSSACSFLLLYANWPYFSPFFLFCFEKHYLIKEVICRPLLIRILVKAVLAKVAPPVKLDLLLKAFGVFAQKGMMEPSVIQVRAQCRESHRILFTSYLFGSINS